MSGFAPSAAPRTLGELTTRLRVPDPQITLHALGRTLVPGSIEADDRIVALAWAVPDVDLVQRQVPLPFKRTARDRLLDGRTAAVRYGAVWLLVEAPHDPEHGRISAFLSRYGEGVAAFYVERQRYLPPARASERPPRAVRTPFGRRGWLLPHDWPWGPFVIALEPER